MSRKTKRAYLRLCPEKDEKNNLVHKGLTEIVFFLVFIFGILAMLFKACEHIE